MSGSSGGQLAGLVVGATIGFATGGVGFATMANTMTTLGAGLSGASLGYSIGGIIDPPTPPGVDVPDVEGPRIEGVRVNMPSENQPIHFIIGPNVRMAGNLIWAGDLIERREEV
jgi:hypothetical protein